MVYTGFSKELFTSGSSASSAQKLATIISRGYAVIKYGDFVEKKEYNCLICKALSIAGEVEKSIKIEKCGKTISIAECNNCKTKHFGGYYKCKDKFCSMCNKERSLAWIAKLLPILQNYILKGYCICLLNFTIVDGEDLEERLALLNNAWRYMTHSNRIFQGRFKQLNIGGIRSLEIKRGKNSKLWHPHFHCIIVKKNNGEKDFQSYRELWEKSTRYCYGSGVKIGSVWIRNISEYNGSIVWSIAESLKYISKINWYDETSADIQKIVKVSRNRRQINTWGCLRGIAKQAEELFNQSTCEELLEKVCSICGEADFRLIVRDFEDIKDLDLLDLKNAVSRDNEAN